MSNIFEAFSPDTFWTQARAFYEREHGPLTAAPDRAAECLAAFEEAAEMPVPSTIKPWLEFLADVEASGGFAHLFDESVLKIERVDYDFPAVSFLYESEPELGDIWWGFLREDLEKENPEIWVFDHDEEEAPEIEKTFAAGGQSPCAFALHSVVNSAPTATSVMSISYDDSGEELLAEASRCLETSPFSIGDYHFFEHPNAYLQVYFYMGAWHIVFSLKTFEGENPFSERLAELGEIKLSYLDPE